MARFSMGNFAPALEDANEAVAADVSYVRDHPPHPPGIPTLPPDTRLQRPTTTNNTPNTLPRYAKGFYRKGQACSKLNRFSEAASSYASAVALEPDSKLFKKLQKKVRHDHDHDHE